MASTKAIFDFLNWPVTEHVQKGVSALTHPDLAKVNPSYLEHPFTKVRDHGSFDPNHWRDDLSYRHARQVELAPTCERLMRRFNYTGDLGG
jgi:hypothetical protein